MSEIFVLGHRHPDPDAIGSAEFQRRTGPPAAGAIPAPKTTAARFGIELVGPSPQ